MENGRRVVVSEYGETPMAALEEHLSIVEQQAPDPETLQSDDVIVRVRSSQVNWVDVIMMSGQYQHMPSPPYCPGLEYAGDVVWAGADASFAVGERVFSDGLLTGPRSVGKHRAWGGFATYAVAPSDAIWALPERLSYDQGCSILGGYETAYHCLVHRGRLKAGETLLIHGASGSIGLAAVHIAKIIGATVIATGRTRSKLELVQAQGADHIVETADADGNAREFRGEVKALTGGGGVDVVYDSVGGAISLESLRCVRFGARFLIAGWAATPFVSKGKGERGAPNANVLPTNLIMMKGLDVLGCPAAISVHRDPSVRVERLAVIRRWLDEGAITPLVGKTYPLGEVKNAMRAKWGSSHVGTVCVHP